MNHPDALQIHDHVYGFERSEHVEACAECRARADALRDERRALRELLREEDVAPPARLLGRRPSWLSLAAAAALLGVLGLLLLTRPDAGPAAAPLVDEEIRRLVVELKSDAPRRRELALLGLEAYGAQAHAALVAAGVEAAVADRFKSPSAADRDLEEKLLQAPRQDFAFRNVPAVDALRAIHAHLPIPIDVQPEVAEALADRNVSFEVKDLALGNAYKLFLSQFGLDAVVLDGRLRIGKPRTFMPSRSPIGLDTALLWSKVEDPAAAAELRRLYTPRDYAVRLPGGKDMETLRLLREKPAVVAVQNLSVVETLDLLRQGDVAVHLSGVDFPHEIKLHCSAHRASTYLALRVAVETAGLDFAIRDGVVVVSPVGAAPLPSPEAGPFWAPADIARRVDRALADLDAPEAERTLLSEAPYAIGPLRARKSPRARQILLRIYQELDLRLADDPPRAYLDDLAPAARALLARRVRVDADEQTPSQILRAAGVSLREEQPDLRAFKFFGELSVRGLLDGLYRSSATLDWRMEGETVVVDTRGNTRAAVEP